MIPVSVSVMTAGDRHAREAIDRRTALSTLAGVEVSPGSGAPPAGSVPAS